MSDLELTDALAHSEVFAARPRSRPPQAPSDSAKARAGDLGFGLVGTGLFRAKGDAIPVASA